MSLALETTLIDLDPASLTLADILERVRPLIDNARADGKSLAVAYVNESGRPSLALRGSTQVFSDHQLCIWLRDASGGFARALAHHAGVALLYRNEDAKTTLTFEGVARIEPSLRDEVYARTPAREQRHDPTKQGTAVIVEIDRVHALYGKVPSVPGRGVTFEREWSKARR